MKRGTTLWGTSAITLFLTEAPGAVILSERAGRARAKDLLVPVRCPKQILRACGAQDDKVTLVLEQRRGESTFGCKIAHGPAEK